MKPIPLSKTRSPHLTTPTKTLLIAIASLVIAACSGSSSELEYDIDLLRLSNLTITGYEIEFDSNKTGPYRIETPNSEKQLSLSFDASDEFSYNYSIQNTEGTQQNDLEGETHFDINLAEGANLVSITLYDEEKDINITYTVYAYRLSSAARLTSYSAYDFINDDGSTLSLSPSFSEAVFDYTATVPYTACAIAYQVTAKNSGVNIQSNDTTVNEREIYYQNILAGENYIDTTVVSEDFSTSERYTIAITRTAPSDYQIESNTNLLTLDTDGDHFQYTCGINNYTFYINNNVDKITFSAKPETEGAKVYTNGKEINPNEIQTINATDDIGTTSITVVSANEAYTQTYSINYIRRNYNAVLVESTAELIAALQTAEPNDQISISTGHYQLDPQTTGMLFSDRSGTALEPIYLTGEQSYTDKVIISGDTENQAALLTLTGKHWNISGIQFQASNTAIHLNGASNITLQDLDIENTSSTAVQLNNGASNNTIKLNRFSDITASGDATAVIYIGNQAAREQDANQLTASAISTANTISQNSFVNMADTHAIFVDSGTTHTDISHNSFVENTQALETTEREPLIVGLGNNTTIRYNSFEFNDPRDTVSLIQLGNTDLHTSWAKNHQLIQNVFDANDRTLDPIANLSTHTALLSENYRSDNIEITYGGSNYDITSIADPTYSIQTTGANTRCLGIEEYEIEDSEYWLVELKTCNSTDLSQQWKIEVDSGIYVALVNQSQDDGHLRTAAEFEELCSASEGVYMSNVYLTEDEGGYVERWLLDQHGDVTYIRNKKDTDYGLTIAGGFVSEGTPLMTCALTGSDAQQFKLVPSTQ